MSTNLKAEDGHEESETPGYVAFAAELLRGRGQMLSFDIYLRRKSASKEMILIFSKNFGIDPLRFTHYLEQGYLELFVKSQDHLALMEFLESSPETILDNPNISLRRRAAALLEFSEEKLTQVFQEISVDQNSVGPEMQLAAKKLIEGYLKAFSRDPRSLELLLKVASHGDYVYSHSLSVAVIGIFIAKRVANSASLNPEALKKLMETCGFAGLLHDLGCLLIPRETLDHVGELSLAQRKEIRNHVQYTMRLIESLPQISDEVRSAIAQHHEEPQGKGYPAALRAEVIFLPARILAVADAYCAMVSERPYRKALTQAAALAKLKEDPGHWDQKIVLELEALLLPVQNAQALAA